MGLVSVSITARAIRQVARPWLPAAAVVYLVVGVIAAIGLASFQDPLTASQWTPLFPLVGSLGILVGALRHQPVKIGAWLSIALGLFLFWIGDASNTGRSMAGDAVVSVSDLAYAAGYPLLIGGAFRLVRGSRGRDWSVYADGAIIAIAGAMLLIVVVDPAGQIYQLPLLTQAVIVADVAIVAMLLPLPIVRETRSPSGILLVIGFALLATADARYGIAAYGGDPIAGQPMVEWLANVAWLSGFVFLGVAGVHASSGTLGGGSNVAVSRRDPLRVVAVSLALLVVPVMVLLEETREDDGAVALALASVAITVLVIVRLRRTLVDLTMADLRFRRFMNGSGMVAAIKDHDGRYTYMNDRALELAGLQGHDWRGRTDDELFSREVAAANQATDMVAATAGQYVSIAEFGGRTWQSEKFRIPGNGGSVGLILTDISDRLRAEAELRQREALLARAEATAHIGSWESDLDSGALLVSDELRRIVGIDPDMQLDRGAFHAFIHPDDRSTFERAYRTLERTGVVEADLRVVRPTGEIRYVHVVVTLESTPAGRRSVGVIEDVTDRREMDERIRMLDAAIGQARDGFVITDRDQRVVYLNPAFEQISGVAASDVLGKPPAERIGKSRSSFARALGHVVKHRRPWMGDVVDRRDDGTLVTSATTISPLLGGDGEVIGHLAIKRDVTRKRADEAATERRARERALIAETLASLRAGRSAEETADEICHQVSKVPEIAMVTIIAFDPDGIATIIGQANRKGTEKTGLVLSWERSDYLRERGAVGPWVERWLDPPAHPYGAMIRDLGITAHAYAPMRFDDEPLGLLIAGSDAPDASAQLAERLPALLEFGAIAGTLLVAPLEARNAAARSERVIRSAIERHAFRTVFQPIVELDGGPGGGTVRGYEALTRFDDGRTPDTWFAEARELGLGLELEVACLRSAISASQTLPDDAWLNVNVSPELVTSGRLQGLLPHLPRQLVLEITEHAAITDYAAFRGAVMLLDGRVRIAVDDAGAGFASLRHIVELGPWLVKLDRSLVAGIDADPARQAVVAGMVHFAEAAGLVLVGEGIETDAELETLRSLGISLGQGYLIGRPEPVVGAVAGAMAGAADIEDSTTSRPPGTSTHPVEGGRQGKIAAA